MPSELGDFLRTRRAKVGPEDIGLVPGGARRVTGLRREEVALAAGVSVDYYRRLEQGRELRPSPEVLAALSSILQLSEPEQQYVYSLAGVARRLDEQASTRPVPPELLALMDSWEEAGAMVLDPLLDIVVLNSRAAELFCGFSETANLLEMVFLDPEGRRFYVDWEAAAEGTVANLRASADFSHTPARLTELLETLNSGSPEFADYWSRHDVQPKTHETKLLHHPIRGRLTADFHAFGVSSAPGYQLLIYRERS
jgi:transcriptional regulator with XRE-family HTH domain